MVAGAVCESFQAKKDNSNIRHDLVSTIVNDWGYEMIKIDFMAWSILAAERYYDPTLSSAQVYRKGLEIMRKAAGDNCHILECGPGTTTIGLIDSMRIEADVNYGFSETAWETYFLHPASSASAAAKRYYFHKRTCQIAFSQKGCRIRGGTYTIPISSLLGTVRL